MKIFPLNLIVFAIGTSLLVQSCSSPRYVENPPPPPPQNYYSDQTAAQPIGYQSFYDELSPYGQWINTSGYGYVWVPSAGPDFQPYASCGHWVLTDYGWTWASDYSWGWAAFHYGSWDFDGALGWYWIPGNQWAPAWVSWRSCNGYYGWAPLGPTYVNGGYATYNCPPERYVFVNARYINDPNVGRYCEPRAQNVSYFNRTTIITNTYYDKGSKNTYYAGPQSTEVGRYTGTPVRPVTLVQASSPEKNNASGSQISMFRPSVEQASGNEMNRPAPQKVYQKTEVAPAANRPVLTKPNQQRAAPFKAENTQHQQGENKQQQQPQQQHAPMQQPQQEKPNQQHAPMQQPQQQQHAPMQQQGHAQQKPVKQKQQKPAKQQKQQAPKQQSQQGQQGKQ